MLNYKYTYKRVCLQCSHKSVTSILNTTFFKTSRLCIYFYVYTPQKKYKILRLFLLAAPFAEMAPKLEFYATTISYVPDTIVVITVCLMTFSKCVWHKANILHSFNITICCTMQY